MQKRSKKMGKMENLVAKFVAKFSRHPPAFKCIQMRGKNQQTERVKPPANPQKQKGLQAHTLYFKAKPAVRLELTT